MSNLRDVLHQLAVPYTEHGESPLVSDGWIGVCCPYCDNGKGRAGLGIHVRTMRTSCWKCGPHSLAQVLAAISGRPAGAVRALLGDLPPEPRPDAPAPGKLVLPPGVGPLLPAHRRYLARRGFDPDELVRVWGLAGIGPAGGLLKWRVFIPVHDPHGKMVSWTTRAIGDVPHGQRYRSAPHAQSAVPRGALLYGEHLARHAVVVTEGPFDVFRVGPGAVCTCGVGFSKVQIARIARFPVRVICFDNEPAAQRRADALATMLAVRAGEVHLVRLSGADPATAPADEIAELRARFLRAPCNSAKQL